MRFADARVIPEFPHVGGCGQCGNCKGQHVANWRARGYVTVIVGDGYSDRCAARTADHVIARGSLAHWCAAQGIVAHEFVDFHDVARIARALVQTPEEQQGTGVVA
jgi:2-hydroxy-3-keto-5-methylthiopentenyl-1-phosphate phosphatase